MYRKIAHQPVDIARSAFTRWTLKTVHTTHIEPAPQDQCVVVDKFYTRLLHCVQIIEITDSDTELAGTIWPNDLKAKNRKVLRNPMKQLENNSKDHLCFLEVRSVKEQVQMYLRKLLHMRVLRPWKIESWSSFQVISSKTRLHRQWWRLMYTWRSKCTVMPNYGTDQEQSLCYQQMWKFL